MTENMRDALKGVGGTFRPPLLPFQPDIPKKTKPHHQGTHPLTSHPTGGLQSTSGAVGDVLGNSMDMRGSKSKKSDEAGKAIGDMGKGELFIANLE